MVCQAQPLVQLEVHLAAVHDLQWNVGWLVRVCCPTYKHQLTQQTLFTAPALQLHLYSEVRLLLHVVRAHSCPPAPPKSIIKTRPRSQGSSKMGRPTCSPTYTLRKFWKKDSRDRSRRCRECSPYLSGLGCSIGWLGFSCLLCGDTEHRSVAMRCQCRACRSTAEAGSPKHAASPRRVVPCVY